MSEESKNQLNEALKITEKIPKRQFAQLLRRIAISLKVRDQVPFTSQEVQEVIKTFELTPSEVEAMFSSCQYMLQQCACFSFNSDKTKLYALDCGINEDISDCFHAVWEAEGDDLIESLKSRTLTDNTLDHSSWRLNIKAADFSKGSSRQPIVLFDLNIPNKDSIKIQFNHQEFSQFYDQIEQIQQQIDKLT